jgi:hypothetical protein
MDSTLNHTKLLLCAGLLALSAAAAANATVNKCVDQDGMATFTDVPCPQGSRLVDPEVSDGPEAGVAINTGNVNGSGIERVPAGVQPSVAITRSRWADLPHPLKRKAIGLDASTLQTARMNLQMQDEMRRQRAVASR